MYHLFSLFPWGWFADVKEERNTSERETKRWKMVAKIAASVVRAGRNEPWSGRCPWFLSWKQTAILLRTRSLLRQRHEKESELAHDLSVETLLVTNLNSPERNNGSGKWTPGNEILKPDEWNVLAIETIRFTPTREKYRKYFLISFLSHLSGEW